MILKIYIIGLFVLLTTCIYAQPDFYKEKIEVELNSKSCCVTGKYYFRNLNNKEITNNIFYPFVVNDSLPFPENIRILSDYQEVKYQKKKNGVVFNISVPAFDSINIVVNYMQPAPYKKMEYILTSTKYWGKGFEKAEYIIKVPKEFTLLNTSLDFNKYADNNDFVVYSTVKYNYMPDKNFTITWK